MKAGWHPTLESADARVTRLLQVGCNRILNRTIQNYIVEEGGGDNGRHTDHGDDEHDKEGVAHGDDGGGERREDLLGRPDASFLHRKII